MAIGYTRYRGTTVPRREGDKPRHKYQARWIHPDTGARIEKQFSHTDKREAQRRADRWRAQQETSADANQWSDPRKRRMTFAELAEEWRQGWVKPRARTRAGYESILHTHLLPRFGSLPVSAITPNEVQRYIKELQQAGKAPNTVRRIVGTLNNALNTAVRREIIAANPCRGGALDLPEGKVLKRPMVIFDEDVQTLVNAMPPEWRLYVQLAVMTGMRAGEVCGLRRCDVDVRASVLRIEGAHSEVYSVHLPEEERGLQRGLPKNGEPRQSALPEALRKPLAEHLLRMKDPSPDALLFTTPTGEPVRHHNVYKKVFRPTVRKLWPEPDPRNALTFHGLRHSCASILARRGVPPSVTQAQLGHKTAAMTNEIYTHVAPDALEVAAAAMDAAWAIGEPEAIEG